MFARVLEKLMKQRVTWIAAFVVIAIIVPGGFAKAFSAAPPSPEQGATEVMPPSPGLTSPDLAPLSQGPLARSPDESPNNCFKCHANLPGPHGGIASKWDASVHGRAGIACADCHGGNPETDEMILAMSPEAGFIGVPPRRDIPALCGGCHSDVERMRQFNIPTDQLPKYQESVHGVKLAQGDIRVAICTDCHGSHDVLKASDPNAAVSPYNVPYLCAKCHSDEALMEPYGLPTDQLDIYEKSVHGEALLGRKDIRAPSCASCHGSHAAKPPTSDEVVNVCGKCHTATQKLYEESLHARIGDAAPKCWTCHGTHDIIKPSEDNFLHPEPLVDQPCGECHVDDTTFRMEAARFESPEDRRCDTCHHPTSWVMTQIKAMKNALVEAQEAYQAAEDAIQDAAARGMIVNDAEVLLTEAHTSIIRARAVVHTTKLTRVTELTDDAKEAAIKARDLADTKLADNLFRRRAMVVVIGIIAINIVGLIALKYQLNRHSEGS